MSAWCQSGSVKSEWCQCDVSVMSALSVWCDVGDQSEGGVAGDHPQQVWVVNIFVLFGPAQNWTLIFEVTSSLMQKSFEPEVFLVPLEWAFYICRGRGSSSCRVSVCFCDFMSYFDVFALWYNVPPLVWISHPFSVFTCVLFVNPFSVYIVCLLPHVFVSLSSVIHLSLLLPVSPPVTPWYVSGFVCSRFYFLCFCLYFVLAFLLPICILASCHSWFWDNIAFGLFSFC